MEIVEIIRESYIDYSGKISSVIFTPGCNFKCPACHVKHIVESNGKFSDGEIFSYLDSRKNWVGGVVLCGGEPTLQPDLEEFARKLKSKGLAVKLDTNGSNPEVLEKLLQEKIIDYVAMDVKATKELYSKVAGVNVDIDKIEKSMTLLANNMVDYEFRTTIVPVIRNGEISWLTKEEVEDMAKWIIDVTGSNNHKYYLQKFVPRKNELLDKRLESFNETSDELIKKIYNKVKEYLPNVKIR